MQAPQGITISFPRAKTHGKIPTKIRTHVILSLHGRTAASISAETRGKHANLMQKWFGEL
jgi:hypothetical protein